MNISNVRFIKRQDVQVIDGVNTYVNVGDNIAYSAVIDGQRWSVPFEHANRLYQTIQEWIAEGNTPEPAEEAAE